MGTHKGGRNISVLGILSALLVACFVLIPASSALAQGNDLPAICDEYPNLPECVVDPDPPEPDPDPNGNPSANNFGGDGDRAGNGDGNLPFTGYPLTGLILLLVILIATGIAIRAGIAARDHLARGPNAP